MWRWVVVLLHVVPTVAGCWPGHSMLGNEVVQAIVDTVPRAKMRMLDVVCTLGVDVAVTVVWPCHDMRMRLLPSRLDLS